MGKPDDLSPDGIRRWVLNQIASGEAGRYNELYGGGSFSSYSDHPRERIPLGNGQYTTAAGRYQFLSPTWDEEAKRLGLTDFSPASQDAAAWDLATRTYREQTGRNLADDAASGNVSWRALAGQWTSLEKRDGGNANASTGGPSDAVLANGPVENGTGVASLASPMQSRMDGMRALALLQQLAPHLTFTPVDYDPFAVIGEKNAG